MDLTQFTTEDNTLEIKNANGDIIGSVKIGIPNIRLTFSQDIDISIPVGSQYDGQTLDIFYQIDGETTWNEETTCLVANGNCTFKTNHATTFGTQEQPENADITSWKAEQYQKPNASCVQRLKLTIKGKHFDKNSEVRIGNTEALSVDKKSSKELTAKFCLEKLLKVKTDLKRTINVTNPDADTKKAKKKIDLSDFLDTNSTLTAKINYTASLDVKSIQTILVKLGYLEEQYITGFYGPITTEAVKKFQSDNGIEQTGTVGPLTRAKLLEKGK
jgi:murein L,D-transpeptidase YcbB/YkuD